MKFQIIAPDNRVAIDGEWLIVDLKAFNWHPAYHAVQFDGDAGEVEWVAMGGNKPPGMPINRDQLYAMFGPIVEHAQTRISVRKAQIADIEVQLAAAKLAEAESKSETIAGIEKRLAAVKASRP